MPCPRRQRKGDKEKRNMHVVLVASTFLVVLRPIIKSSAVSRVAHRSLVGSISSLSVRSCLERVAPWHTIKKVDQNPWVQSSLIATHTDGTNGFSIPFPFDVFPASSKVPSSSSLKFCATQSSARRSKVAEGALGASTQHVFASWVKCHCLH